MEPPLTITTQVPLAEPSVRVMVARPAATADTLPSEETVATFSSLLLQVYLPLPPEAVSGMGASPTDMVNSVLGVPR